MYWSILLNAITGNLPNIISVITNIFGKLSDNDTARLVAAAGVDKDVALAQLQATADAYHTRTDMMKGMWITQWLLAAALLPPIIHIGAVMLDSTPFWHHAVGTWGVPSPPPPYDGYEWQMVASLLGIQTINTLGLGLTRALLRFR